jgi:diaminohydroxyphosphoribosylaminopyrimidine deaminase/5-amino-6-(5-phosphoribosylamino)uracil reductase
MGTLMDIDHLDEIHVFIGPRLIGGKDSRTAVAGAGILTIAEALRLSHVEIQELAGDIYIKGRIVRSPGDSAE